MKNLFIQRIRKSTVFILLFAVLVITVISMKSLDYYSFEMAGGSEEAGIAFRGFPFPILKSTAVFYAGYVGQLAKEGGSEYIRNSIGAQNYRLHFPGVLANLLIYGILVTPIVILDINRHYLVGQASDILKKDGGLLGGAKITGIVIVGGISLLLAISLAVCMVVVVMTTSWP